MTLSLVIACFAGLFFCLSSIYMRKGMYQTGESYTSVLMACFTGTLFLGLAILATGQIKELAGLSWQGLMYLCLAGFVHFIAGRALSYSGTRLIGANLGNPILNTQTLVSVILAVTILGEPLTVYLVLACILIIGGVILIGRSGQGEIGGEKLKKATLIKGILISIGGAVCFGMSPMLVKLGLRDGVSAMTGAFVSYTAAAIILALSLFNRASCRKLRRMGPKPLGFIGLSSAILSGAQLLRYMAIGEGAVSLVTLIFGSISSLVVFPLSYLINRKIEVFNTLVVVGAFLTIAGVVVVFLRG